MFLGTLSAVHEAAKVTRGGFVDRPLIHLDIGAMKFTCSVDDARALGNELLRAAGEAHREQASAHARCVLCEGWAASQNFGGLPADGILRGNADLSSEHATLRPAA